MVYNTNKYSFTQKNMQQDKIPTWMDDNFFDKLQQVKNDNFMEKTASLFNENKTCKCCNAVLQDNEVNFCKSCINK